MKRIWDTYCLNVREALKEAFYIGEMEEKQDNGSYTIQTIEIIYVNGLPYYSFYATGSETRTMQKGYALAVNIEASDNQEQLLELHNSFRLD